MRKGMSKGMPKGMRKGMRKGMIQNQCGGGCACSRQQMIGGQPEEIPGWLNVSLKQGANMLKQPQPVKSPLFKTGGTRRSKRKGTVKRRRH